MDILTREYGNHEVKQLQRRHVMKELEQHLDYLEENKMTATVSCHMQTPWDLSNTDIRFKSYNINNFSYNTAEIVKKAIKGAQRTPFIILEWDHKKPKRNKFYQHLIASFHDTNEPPTSILIKVNINELTTLHVPPSHAHITVLVNLTNIEDHAHLMKIKNINAIGFSSPNPRLYDFATGQYVELNQNASNITPVMRELLILHTDITLYVHNDSARLIKMLSHANNGQLRQKIVIHPDAVCTTSIQNQFLIDLVMSCRCSEIDLLTQAIFNENTIVNHEQLTMNWLRECPTIVSHGPFTFSGQIRQIIAYNNLIMDWRKIPQSSSLLHYMLHYDNLMDLYQARSHGRNHNHGYELGFENTTATISLYKHAEHQNRLFIKYKDLMQDNVTIHQFWAGLCELVAAHGLDLPADLINKTKCLLMQQMSHGPAPMIQDPQSFLASIHNRISNHPTTTCDIANDLKILRDCSSPPTIIELKEKDELSITEQGIFRKIASQNQSDGEKSPSRSIRVHC